MRFRASASLQTLLFSVALLAASPVARAEDETPVDPKAVACQLNLQSAESAGAIVDRTLLKKLLNDELKAEKKNDHTLYERAVLTVFARKIKTRALEQCVETKACTPDQISRLLIESAEQQMGKARRIRGYLTLASIQGATYYASYMISTHLGGSVQVTMIVSGIIQRFIDHLQAPLFSLEIDPPLKKAIFGTVTKEKQEAKPINAGFTDLAGKTTAVYTTAEQGGRGALLGAQTDLFNKLNNLYIRFDPYKTNITAERVSVQDNCAWQLAVMLFQSRTYHADLGPDNLQFLSLFRPSIRPAAALYEPLKGKIFAAIEKLEMIEAIKVQGKTDFDRKAAQDFYTRITHEWFEKDLPELSPIDSLLKPE